MDQEQINIARDKGAMAYKDGNQIYDNPHNKDSERVLHEAWNDGWKFERSYWES